MSQKNIKWTNQQSRAIEEHRRNVFVSASAGTGKTAVLSGSCVDAVMNISACPDVWSILVVTFTDMAAEEMRSRIARQLNSAIDTASDAALCRHLRRQLILLGAADISTIHSFCKRLITEHFHQLSLDPTFGIIDADEAKLLKAETLEKTIDWAWKQDNLADALRQFFARRDLRTTDGFPARIIEISDFLDGVVSRSGWLKRAEILAESTDPFATDLAQNQKQIIVERLQTAAGRIRHAEKIYCNASGGNSGAKFEALYIKPITHLLEILESGDWTSFSEAIRNYPKPRVEKPKDVDKELAELVHKTIKDAVDSVADVCDLAVLNPDYLNRLTGAVSTQTMVLLKLVERFDVLYRQAKNAINCLDFADLEHYALRLLTSEQSAETKLEPSQTALALRDKYKYIFVDECQDINGVQQAILDMLSKEDNVFAVGDPKQSIYQWRGANPEIFLKHLKQAACRPATAKLDLRVDLNVNFRSVKPILDFVNLVFGRIMTASFTNIDYDESAHLHPAPDKDTPPLPDPAVELHILDDYDNKQGEEQAADQLSPPFTDRQLQAAMIADRIKQIVGADDKKQPLQIIDKQTGRPRPVEYRDVVVLMRKLTGKNDFVEVLRLAGVPVSCETAAGYFEATEITDMLSLLKVLDNPRRDIELASILRSPLFSFTDTELAKIRLFGKKDDRKPAFCDCVFAFCDSGNDCGLADKLKQALAKLDEWRTIARRGRLAELIWHIYRQTGCLSFVSALPDGPARKANLLKLHDRAIQFEGFAGSWGVPSLTRFIEFVEKLLAAGQDWAPAEPESAAGNAVRILSVHKSKGLEFPVVFLADLDSPFNTQDSKSDCIVDEQLTVGLRIIDADSNTRLDSLAYQVIEERNRRQSLAEEMRILYVAMTRAMNRLILVGCENKNNCQRILSSAFFFEDGPVPRWYLDSYNSHLDWILCALGRHPSLHQAFQTALMPRSGEDNLLGVQIYDQPQLNKLSALIQNSKLNTKHSKPKTQAGGAQLCLAQAIPQLALPHPRSPFIAR